MNEKWQDQRRIPARAEPRRDRDNRSHGRERGSDEERWGRRCDRYEQGAWFAEARRCSQRRRGEPHGLSGRDLAHRIEELGSFDPYENVPPFRNRSGQENWPGGAKARQQAGSFRGKGPRGYKRPDARIAEDVNDRLTEDPWLDASDIEVSVSSGEVILGGFVSSRKDKRRAEDCAETVSGVSELQNNIRVRRSGMS
jgi:hypothetical protein